MAHLSWFVSYCPVQEIIALLAPKLAKAWRHVKNLLAPTLCLIINTVSINWHALRGFWKKQNTHTQNYAHGVGYEDQFIELTATDESLVTSIPSTAWPSSMVPQRGLSIRYPAHCRIVVRDVAL